MAIFHQCNASKRHRVFAAALRFFVFVAIRAMVVCESVMTAGVAAELAARISEECFDFLDSPVVRVAGEDIPIPVAPELEKLCVPYPQLIIRTARRLMR